MNQHQRIQKGRVRRGRRQALPHRGGPARQDEEVRRVPREDARPPRRAHHRAHVQRRRQAHGRARRATRHAVPYAQDGSHTFMNTETYRPDLRSPTSSSADALPYLKEGDVVQVIAYGEEPLGVELPAAMELEVVTVGPRHQGRHRRPARPSPPRMETGLVVERAALHQPGRHGQGRHHRRQLHHRGSAPPRRRDERGQPAVRRHAGHRGRPDLPGLGGHALPPGAAGALLAPVEHLGQPARSRTSTLRPRDTSTSRSRTQRGALRCAFFRNRNAGQRERLEHGASVLVYGSLSLYEQRGDLNFVVDFVQPEGVGALAGGVRAASRSLRGGRTVRARAEARAASIPPAHWRRHVGDGRGLARHLRRARAALAARDARASAGRSYRDAETAVSVADAIRRLDREQRLDAIIVARGGGSLEDLWALQRGARGAGHLRRPRYPSSPPSATRPT